MLRALHVFSTFAVGGQQARFATLADRLPEGYAHAVTAMDGEFAAQALVQRRDRITIVPPPLKHGAPWRRAWSARALLRAVRPDLVLTYNWGAIEITGIARLLGLPVVHFEDGFGPAEAVAQIPRRLMLRRLVIPRASAVVVPSSTLAGIARTLWRVPAARLHQVDNGVDAAAYDRAVDPAAIPGLTRAPGEIVVGTVAALRAEKNIPRLVRALASVAAGRNLRLVVVGSGAEEPAIRAAAAAAGLADRLVMPGFIAQPARYLGLFDVFALSSDTEQFPISLVEAMAARLPVVATDVGDVRRILPPENQPLIVARTDEAGFAAALARLIDEPGLRRTLAAANRAKVERDYTLDAMVKRYDRLFRHCAGRD